MRGPRVRRRPKLHLALQSWRSREAVVKQSRTPLFDHLSVQVAGFGKTLRNSRTLQVFQVFPVTELPFDTN